MSIKRLKRTVAVPLLALALASCTGYAEVQSLGFPPARHVEIPKGHLPPPGECRIWFPDRPPGQQPPPGPCNELRYNVPPGAYLVEG